MNSKNLRENWDWALMYYAGRVILNMSDDEFWKCTPRTLFTLLKIHGEVKGSATKNPENEKRVIKDQKQAIAQFMKW